MLPNALTGRLPVGPNWVRFARFTPGSGHTPYAEPFAHILQSLQVWLRFAQFPPSAAPAGRNWVRFGQSPSDWNGGIMGIRPGGRPSGIGFVLRICPSAGPNWVRSARFEPRIGFVLHDRARAGPRRQAAGQASRRKSVRSPQSRSWVRFAHLTPGARPQPASFNPQSAITNPQLWAPAPPLL
jgi:hypothetical protein